MIKYGKGKKGKMHQKVALPTEKKSANFNLLEHILLIYGREKIGKTTFCSSFPSTLFLTTEPGTKGLEIYEYNSEDGGCTNWKMIKDAVDLVCDGNKFKTVVIDTVDRAYDLCLDYICKECGIEYPGEDEMGRQDRGKSWRFVKQEFMATMHKLIQSGKGLILTSHAKEQPIKTKSGVEYTKIFPSMSGQARSVVEALVDLFFYVDYASDKSGKSIRVIITEGDELIWAGYRSLQYDLPKFIPLTPEGGYEILSAAFSGEDVGLDPKTFYPRKTSSSTIKKFFMGERRAKPERRVLKKKKKKKSSRS